MLDLIKEINFVSQLSPSLYPSPNWGGDGVGYNS